MIRLSGLVYVVGTFRLEVSLDIGDGEYFVIMGPTGSGKTAAVECLAGLRQPQSGRIEVSGRDVTGAEPRHRAVGYVPQDYALFMHRTVRRNIAFGPEVRGWPAEKIGQAVRESAGLLGIEHLLDRRIPGLSGGERQRVALARALAVKPEVLILDEPVSALDESTREAVCGELRRVQRQLNLTTLHVSHNLEEAFSVADRAAVMRDGRIEQVGRMEDLLRRPINDFVARFMRFENIVQGKTISPGLAGTMLVEVDGQTLTLVGKAEGPVTLVFRPENVSVARTGGSSEAKSAYAMAARLVRAVDRGAYVRLELAGSRPLVSHMSLAAFRQSGLVEGVDVRVTVRPEDIHVISGDRKEGP